MYDRYLQNLHNGNFVEGCDENGNQTQTLPSHSSFHRQTVQDMEEIFIHNDASNTQTEENIFGDCSSVNFACVNDIEKAVDLILQKEVNLTTTG